MASATAVDLFAGLGGFSEGAEQAGIEVVWAGNHWELAVDYHRRNHPRARHVCQDLHQADWSTLPRHDFLLASPSCQGFSPARGKDRPHHDALRSTAWAVVSAVEFHRPAVCVIENVPAFRNWALFPAWSQAMQALGYALEFHEVDAADHGVPQHRVRLFVVATRSRHAMQLKLPQLPHVAIATALQMDQGRWTDIERHGRSGNTLRRVAAGRSRFGERFIMPYYGSGSGLTGRCLQRPLGTLTTRARWALVKGRQMRMLLPTEARAAMGFPERYELPTQTAQALHLLGNAVAPPVARNLLNAIKAAA